MTGNVKLIKRGKTKNEKDNISRHESAQFVYLSISFLLFFHYPYVHPGEKKKHKAGTNSTSLAPEEEFKKTHTEKTYA